MWRLVPADAVPETAPAVSLAEASPLDSVRDPALRKKADAIWSKIKNGVQLDADQRVLYSATEKGSPLPALLTFLVSAEQTRPFDLHRFISIIRRDVPVSYVHKSKRKLFM